MKEMHILFYMTTYTGYGGIETVTSQVLGKLCALDGIKVTVIAHLNGNNPHCFTKGIDYRLMPDSVPSYTKKNFDFAEGIVSAGAFDAIVYQDSYAYTEKIVCTLSRKYNIPLYVFEHNSPLFIYNKRSIEPVYKPKGFLRHVLHPWLLHRDIKRRRYLLEHCRRYVLLSEHYIPEFCHLTGTDINNEKLAYINNPTMSFNLNPGIEKQNVILTVSRLVKEKRISEMLNIWKAISGKLPDWKFQIVGEGPEKERLHRMKEALKLSNVEFVGYANPAEYYQKAKIFWMTSSFEGWPMTLFEAMQCGCVPIVYKSFSSVVDIVDDKQNGRLIENNDFEGFKEATLDLANNGTTLHKYSMNGIAKTEHYKIDVIFEKWKQLFQI